MESHPEVIKDRAFPGRRYMNRDHSLGMSLRDYFAGQALAGVCADPAFSWDSKRGAAEFCYRVADAMIRARERGGE